MKSDYIKIFQIGLSFFTRIELDYSIASIQADYRTGDIVCQLVQK